MRKVFTFSFLFLLFVSSNYAQSGKISGYVKDAMTGEALFGTNVILQGTTLGASSDIDGYYVILNVPPGTYSLKSSMIGFNSDLVNEVIVSINQTTEINFSLKSKTLQTEEIVVTAIRPVVQKDIASSTINLSAKEIQNLPISTVSGAVGLQAGIKGLEVRGGSYSSSNNSAQTAFMLNGQTLRDERTNQPFTSISFTSVDEIQVQTGGFNAEYGNLRSGVINAVTKEGKTDRYNVSFIGRYRPAGKKSFENNPSDKNSFYLRPFLDDAVCWTGTDNGAWDDFTQKQYTAFKGGWNSYVLTAASPYKGMTPEAAQKLFLYQHRKDLSIQDPDYDYDLSVSGPFPEISKYLGNLRFLFSLRAARSMYLIPLTTDNTHDYTSQLKVTSDVAQGMKLTVEGLMARSLGTSSARGGDAGMFTSSDGIAGIEYAPGSFGEAIIYTDNWYCPTDVSRQMVGAKFTHVLNSSTFYEVNASYFATQYNKIHDRYRDFTTQYEYAPGYYFDEGPFGYAPLIAITGIGSNMKIGGNGTSYGWDSSKVYALNFKVDLSMQYDKYNLFKTGVEFKYTGNSVHNGAKDPAIDANDYTQSWQNFPLLASFYVQDKIEYEALVATLGVRFDYSDPNTDWYSLPGLYDASLSGSLETPLESIAKVRVKKQLNISPRIGVSFPITTSSKLYFNYGHSLQTVSPDNLFRVQRVPYLNNRVGYISDPNIALAKTIAYEIGYEQSFFDEFLFRINGYYKDISNQPRDVNFYSNDNSVRYSTPKADIYEDVRGFEVTINRNRGEWITGFFNYTYSVASYGYFNFKTYYENPSAQRDYERAFIDNDQRKPIARPYARLNFDIFTPENDFGPQTGGIGIFNDWRLNILASWTAGEYFTWTGGGTAAPGYSNNFQWSDSYNVDLRISKSFKIGPASIQLFADIYNALNIKTMSRYNGWVAATGSDFDDYMKSLHLPDGQVETKFGYLNIPGDDSPGKFRDYSVQYTPMVAISSESELANVTKGASSAIYYIRQSGRYTELVNGQWVDVDKGRIDKINKDKSYIDMPNMGFFSFLNPRNIFFGIKFSLEIK